VPRPDVASPGFSETLVASAARMTTGDSGILYGWGAPSQARVQLEVTAVSGLGPTLDVVVEDTLDGVTWNVVGTFAQKTAVGREVINLSTPFTDRLRVRWTITDAVTFSVIAYSE
jgi:hypothetical protein